MDRWTICLIGIYLLAVDHVVMVFPADTDDRWSSWSTWSECSRTCDGGASYQLRQCHDDHGTCAGNSIRYKTCNNEPCPPGGVDFRSQQCQAYNDVTYRGKLYSWNPFYDVTDPCSLQCTADGEGFRVMLAPKVLDGTRCYQGNKDMCINGICRAVGCDHVLGSTLKDDGCGVCGGEGTSCMSRRQPSKNGGKTSEIFTWKYSDFTPCSVSCGVGDQTSTPVCVDTLTGSVKDPLHCDRNKRPSPQMRTCSQPSCHPTWITAEWQPCSRTCGGGTSSRNVHCVRVMADGSFTRTGELCRAQKPTTHKPCNNFPCPVWMSGDWAPCSVTCGSGVQHREVICRPTKDHECSELGRPGVTQRCHTGVDCVKPEVAERNLESMDEEPADDLSPQPPKTAQNHPAVRMIDNRPKDLRKQDAQAGQNPAINSPNTHSTLLSFKKANELFFVPPSPPRTEALEYDSGADRDADVGHGSEAGRDADVGHGSEADRDADGGYGSEAGRDADGGYASEAGRDADGGYGSEAGRDADGGYASEAGRDADGGSGQAVYGLERHGNTYNVIGSHNGRDFVEGPPVALVGEVRREVTVSTTPSFVMTEWSKCSATCGAGLRNRRVTCHVYLEFAKTVQTLPLSECTDPKPSETEVCKLASCNIVSPLERDVYIWSFTGHGPCNATCIGGYKNATFSCKRVRDFATVSSHYCHHIHLPEMNPLMCNVIPCDPQWQTSPAGPCSALCGGGYQILRILCIRRFGWGRNDIQIVKPQHCDRSLQPQRKTVCNTRSCPPSWRVGPWSECSKTCGRSSHTRDVLCERRIGPGLNELVSNKSLCEGVKPSTKKDCELPRCPGNKYKEYIKEDNSWFVQLKPIDKLYLDVGGRATVLPRTTIKIKCSARKISRDQIVWKHDGVEIPEQGRIRRSRKGLLLIRKSRSSDGGVYTCVAGNAVANMTVDFHLAGEAARKLADRAHLIARLGSFYHSSRISEAKASLLAMEKQLGHWSLIPFHYVTAAWSECSRSCGGAGLQSRRITCDFVLPSYYFMVRDDLCTNHGQEKPVDSRDCGFQKCPHWEISDWSECSDKHCVRNKYGAQLRNLLCVSHENSMVDLKQCDAAIRPSATLACPADRCYARWQTSSWSRCSRTCGGNGVKTRALNCIWALTGKPAGANCRGVKRPGLVKECNSPKTCNNGCRDRSKYCSLIPRLNFCRFKQYSDDCCESCAAHDVEQEQRNIFRQIRRV